MTLDPALQIAAIITGVTGALAGIGWLIRSSARLLRKMSDVHDDIMGEPARPGVPERPGMMPRLAAIEQTQEDIKATQAQIVAEVLPNGGGSLRDAVARTEKGLEELRAELAAHKAEHARNPVTVNVSQLPPPSTP